MKLSLRLQALVPVILMLTGTSACADEPELALDDAVFAGLDHLVVQETLDSPYAKKFIEQVDKKDSRIYYQGMIRATINCRSYHRAYEHWLATGTPPQQPPPAQATHPEPRVDADEQFDTDAVRNALQSGDPTRLRAFLTAGGSCGEWVPAEPRDYSGPTISDAVGGPVDSGVD